MKHFLLNPLSMNYFINQCYIQSPNNKKHAIVLLLKIKLVQCVYVQMIKLKKLLSPK